MHDLLNLQGKVAKKTVLNSSLQNAACHKGQGLGHLPGHKVLFVEHVLVHKGCFYTSA